MYYINIHFYLSICLLMTIFSMNIHSESISSDCSKSFNLNEGNK